MNIKLTIPLETVANLLCSAIEGGQLYGCGYWGYADDETSERPVVPGDDLVKASGIDWLDEEYWYIHWPLFEGGVLGFVEHNEEYVDGKPEYYELTLGKMYKGLEVMAEKYPHRFADILRDEVDGPLGEEALQCALFGEIKYG